MNPTQNQANMQAVPLETFLENKKGHPFHGEWFQMTQERINLFADATLDHHWIHTDPERSATESKFKATIAHGYLTLSLIPFLCKDLFDELKEHPDIQTPVNYGTNQVRFPAPLKAGQWIRSAYQMKSIEVVEHGIRAIYQIDIEIKGEKKPACASEILFFVIPNP